MDKLFEAVRLGSVEGIRNVLAQGVDVNSQNSYPESALHLAYYVKSSDDVVQCLIDAGANHDIRVTPYKRSLFVLWMRDDISKMKILVNAGANVNTKGFTGRTPLHWAAIKRDVDCMRFLIERGAEVDAKNDEDVTPLFDSLNWKDFSPIECLLKAKADINIKVCDMSPLSYLISTQTKKDEEVSYEAFSNLLILLSKYNYDLNARNRYGGTYIDEILNRMPSKFYCPTIKALIEIGGLSVNCRYKPEYSFDKQMKIIHFACSKNDLKFIKLILKNGANINVFDYKNRTPLFYAIRTAGRMPNISKDIISYLFEHDPDVNTISTDGRNILNCCDDEYPGYLWKAIVQHLAKLIARGLEIHESLKNTIKNKKVRGILEYNRHFLRCKTELEFLKDQMFPSESSVTFFNILVDNQKKLFQYAENLDLVADFYEINFVSRFPIYGDQIQKRFTKIVHKKEVMKHSAALISSWLQHRSDPDSLVIRKIISYLKFKDLRAICKNFSAQ